MLKKIVDIAHDMLMIDLKESDIAIDFTCGSGNDSKFLCDHVKYVYSYDIQESALDEAKNLLNDINSRGTTVVMATHAKDIVNKMKKRVIQIEKGVIVRDDKKGGYNSEI